MERLGLSGVARGGGVVPGVGEKSERVEKCGEFGSSSGGDVGLGAAGGEGGKGRKGKGGKTWASASIGDDLSQFLF